MYDVRTEGIQGQKVHVFLRAERGKKSHTFWMSYIEVPKLSASLSVCLQATCQIVSN